MAIPIRQQVLELKGVLIQVVTDVKCPRCGRLFTELREESVNIERRGTPAPYVAPTWGEDKRRLEVAGDLRRLVEDREANGISPLDGSSRCPHCLLGVRAGPDPSFSLAAWIVLDFLIAVAAAVVASYVAGTPLQLTQADATDRSISIGVWVGMAAFVVMLAVTFVARKLAIGAMNRPSRRAPARALVPEGWELLRRRAEEMGVHPAALWHAEYRGTPLRVGPSVDSWVDRSRLPPHLQAQRVLWIVTTRTADEALGPRTFWR